MAASSCDPSTLWPDKAQPVIPPSLGLPLIPTALPVITSSTFFVRAACQEFSSSFINIRPGVLCKALPGIALLAPRPYARRPGTPNAEAGDVREASSLNDPPICKGGKLSPSPSFGADDDSISCLRPGPGLGDRSLPLLTSIAIALTRGEPPSRGVALMLIGDDALIGEGVLLSRAPALALVPIPIGRP